MAVVLFGLVSVKCLIGASSLFSLHPPVASAIISVVFLKETLRASDLLGKTMCALQVLLLLLLDHTFHKKSCYICHSVVPFRKVFLLWLLTHTDHRSQITYHRGHVVAIQSYLKSHVIVLIVVSSQLKW